MAQQPDIFSLRGRTALVTGAGQGVGEGIARLLAAYGAQVVVNDYSRERALAVAAQIQLEGGSALGLQADVTDYAAVQAMFEQATQAFGGVDVLVNNAGNGGPNTAQIERRPFWQSEPGDWSPWLGVNLYGVLNCSRHALPGMVERKRGRLVTIISDAGRAGEGNGLEAYSAAKAGAAGLMRGVARSVGRFGITANCVAISATASPAISAQLADPDFMKRALAGYIVRRVGQPEDVAAAVLFLASDAAGWVTGQTYPVNGGFCLAL